MWGIKQMYRFFAMNVHARLGKNLQVLCRGTTGRWGVRLESGVKVQESKIQLVNSWREQAVSEPTGATGSRLPSFLKMIKGILLKAKLNWFNHWIILS